MGVSYVRTREKDPHHDPEVIAKVLTMLSSHPQIAVAFALTGIKRNGCKSGH